MKNMTKAQKHAVLVGFCLMFAYGVTNNALSYLVSPVTEAIGCSRASFNFYYTIMSIVGFLSAPLFGQLHEKMDVRKILVFGGMLGAVCLLGFSFCSMIPMFYVIAAVLGFFQSGCTNMAAVVVVNRAFPGNSGSATGLAMAGTGVCSLVLSFVLPAFIGTFGWRNAYRLQAVVWFAIFALAVALVEGKKAESAEQGAEAGTGTKTGTETKTGTGAKAGADEKVQPQASAKGLTYKQALASPVLYIFMVTIVILCGSQMFLQHMPAYFQELGHSATVAGSIMSVFSLFLIFCKIGLGSLFDKLGPIKTTVIAIAAYALSLVIMSQGSLAFLYMGAALAAFGMASSTVLTPLLTKHIFGTKEYAAIWGMVTMASGFGAGFGSPIWGAAYDVTGTYKPAVMVAPAVILANLAVIVILMKMDLWGRETK